MAILCKCIDFNLSKGSDGSYSHFSCDQELHRRYVWSLLQKTRGNSIAGARAVLFGVHLQAEYRNEWDRANGANE
jgi:hypothetical protein